MKNEEDRKTVANAMETQVSALLKDRNEVPDENDEQDPNNEQHHSSPEPPPSPPPSPVPPNNAALQNSSQTLDQMTVQYPSLQQSKEVDLIKTLAAEKLSVPGVVPETIPMENTPLTSN